MPHFIRRSLTACALSLTLAASGNASADGETIGSVKTALKLIGSNHTIEVERFEDPDVAGASCFISYAKKGGLKGAFGLAEDTSDASVACRQTGAIRFDPKEIEQQEQVFSERRSILFKNLRVVRIHDPETQTFVYLTYSNKLIDGSPKNAISAIHYGGPYANTD